MIERLTRGLNRHLIGMCAHEECPFFDSFLPLICFNLAETGPLERTRDIAGHVAGCFTERC